MNGSGWREDSVMLCGNVLFLDVSVDSMAYLSKCIELSIDNLCNFPYVVLLSVCCFSIRCFSLIYLKI